MEPSRSTQVPEMLERQETPSASSTELQLFSHQREEDQQQEDRHFGLKIFFYLKFYLKKKMYLVEKEKLQSLYFHCMTLNKPPNLQLNAYHVKSQGFRTNTENVKNLKHSYMFWHILTASIPQSAFLASEKKPRTLYPMISTTTNTKELLASHFPLNYRFNTHKGQQLKDNFKKQTNDSDETKLFQNIMTFVSDEDVSIPVYANRHRLSLLKHYHKKHKGKDKQYAFAVVFLKNGKKKRKKKKFFPAVYPEHQNRKNNSAATKHSEEILIGQIDEFLKRNGTRVQCIFIYTLNSPCLKREKNIEPCMFQLLDRAHQWHSTFGFFTSVAFTKFWGLRGPNCFKGLTFSNISCPSSDFYPYFESCEKTPFKLDHELFHEKTKNVYNKLIKRVEAKDRKKQFSLIQSAVTDLRKLAGSSFGFRKEHLDRGVKKIASFTFNQQVQDEISDILTEKWELMVTNSFMPHVREKITTDFNRAVVQRFFQYQKPFLGNSSPLLLVQVPQIS